MATLSIVIPTKNEEHHLPRLLRSIKKQTRKPDEVIIADAQSTDQTRTIAKKMGAIVVDGGMPGVGRNRGAEQATGDLLLFLDADVVLDDPAFLEKAELEFIERGLDIATADVKPLKGSAFDHFSHGVYNTYVRLLGDFQPHAPGFFILTRASLHQKIHGFDESVVFLEDRDYATRAAKKGRFGFLESVAIPVSTRRLARDGLVGTAVRYTLADLYYMTLGPIRSNIFHYTFGHEPKKETYGGEKQTT